MSKMHSNNLNQKNIRQHVVLLILLMTFVVLFSYLFTEISSAASRDVIWRRFQNSDENNGVTDAPTPTSYDQASLRWGKQLVEGYSNSFTPPLIIDDYLYTTSINRVLMINKYTGEVVKQSEKIDAEAQYAMHPMTYAEDRDALYVPLVDGRVQCIDVNTLSLKWLSKSYTGHQALSPIAYKDGYLYEGTWEKETKDGVFFCLDADTGKTKWEMRPSELKTETTARALDMFEIPLGMSSPDNYYTYTALIKVKPKTGYEFAVDEFGQTWLYDANGNKVRATSSDYAEKAVSVNGHKAGLDINDDGTATIRVRFNYTGSSFEQEEYPASGSVEIKGLDTPVVGKSLDETAVTSSPVEIDNITWKTGDIPHGFYWAGAYVNDKYVIVGSDDGQENTFGGSGDSSYTNTATLYCFDRETGDIVDRIDKLRGDVRSTIVYHNGYIYFTSKGGVLYKAKVSSDGTFSKLSSFDTKAMMSASPVVSGGRIYVGIAGMGGQFSADGNHMFAVFSDDEELTGEAEFEKVIPAGSTEPVEIMNGGTGSFIYCTMIQGYPQASPVLSTSTKESDGISRLYFTYNAFPGGIYYLEDSPAATKENPAEAKQVFRPWGDMQQYCISPIAVDKDGTMYIKNDSGYLMAVEVNKAYLNDIIVKNGEVEADWDTDFRSGQLEYVITAEDGASDADVTLDVPSGMTATVNGIQYAGDPIKIPVTEDSSSTSVVVSNTVSGKKYERTYTLNISSKSNNANLKGIAINDNNTAPKSISDYVDDDGIEYHTSNPGNSGLGFDPTFDPGITKYVTKTYTGCGGNGYRLGYVNLWIEKDDPKSTVKVYPVDGVGNDAKSYRESDGTIPLPSNTGGKLRYPIYWIKGKISAEVRIEVTSESGKAKKSYNVELVRAESETEKGVEPLIVSPVSVKFFTSSGKKTEQITAMFGDKDVTSKCTWESARPDKVTVDANGMITSQGQEVAEDNPVAVWATYNAQSAPIYVTVIRPKTATPTASIVSGTYSSKKEVTLTSATPGATVYYNIGDPGTGVVAPTASNSTKYSEPIELGEAGTQRSYMIRAIAVSDNGQTSDVAQFTYTVDLRETIGTCDIEDLDTPEAGRSFDQTLSCKHDGVSVSSIKWYKVEAGTETEVSGTAESGKPYIARVSLTCDKDKCKFDENAIVRLGDRYARIQELNEDSLTAYFDFNLGNTIGRIDLIDIKRPIGGVSFDHKAYVVQEGLKIDSMSWKDASGKEVSGIPDYYMDYTAEVILDLVNGYSLASGCDAYINIDGESERARITKLSDSRYKVSMTVRSSKFVLDTSSSNGLSVSPVSLTGLANGISSESIRQKILTSCTVKATADNGNTVDIPMENVLWGDDQSLIFVNYDPSDLNASTFGAVGKVTLPDYIDANGSSREVVVTIGVSKSTVKAPTFTPKSATYTAAKTVKITSATPGASIYYTRSDKKGTFAYEGPIKLSGKANKKVAYTFKAYAMAYGLKSKVVKYTITIDRSRAAIAAAKKLKVVNFKVKAKKGKREFVLSWKRNKKAGGYLVKCRLSTAKKWKTLTTVKKNSKIKFTTKKLKKGKKYSFCVCTFKKVDGRKYYGKWTKVKTVKCK